MPWQVIATTPTDLHRWQNEFVLYDPLSGDTHLLELAAGRIMQILMHSPAELMQLEQSLSSEFPEFFASVGTDSIDISDFRNYLEDMLNDLRACNLIEQV